MARGDGTYAPRGLHEMNAYEAKRLVVEIAQRHPEWTCVVMHLAQGLARVKVYDAPGAGSTGYSLRDRRDLEILEGELASR